MPATSYRYIFANAKTNEVLAELPITGVQFDQKLNTYGSMAGHILLTGIDTTKFNLFNATIPSKCALYIDRNGIIVWGGIISFSDYDSKTQILEFNGFEWLWWLSRRVIKNTSVFTAQDECFIAHQLVTNAQAETYGSVGLLYNTDPTSTLVSGVLVTQTYFAFELRQVLQAIDELSQADGGFDYDVECYYDGSGVIQKAFNTFYPRRGTAYSTALTIPVLELPAGNIVSYGYPQDGSVAANTVYGIGSGNNDGKLIATAQDTSKLLDGWVLLEDVINNSSITDATLLANLAAGEVLAKAFPPTTIKVVLNPNQDPFFGTYEVGDDIRLRITDKYFAGGYDEVWRIVALSVTAGETSAEQITLTLAQNTI